jgi:hypothetical protein
MLTVIAAIAALVAALCCAYQLGARAGFRQASDIVSREDARRLEALRSGTERDARIQRALLTSVRGGRA